MFNKTDTAKSSDAQKPAAPIRSQQVTNSIVQLPNKPTNATADNSLVNRVNLYFQRLSLGTKATMLAIAIGTVPVVVIGAIAYNLANKSITQQITQIIRLRQLVKPRIQLGIFGIEVTASTGTIIASCVCLIDKTAAVC